MGVKHLTAEDRFYIEKRLTDKTSIRCIAKELGRCPGTISREVRRNTPSDFQGLYSYRAATNLSEYRCSDVMDASAPKLAILCQA